MGNDLALSLSRRISSFSARLDKPCPAARRSVRVTPLSSYAHPSGHRPLRDCPRKGVLHFTDQLSSALLCRPYFISPINGLSLLSSHFLVLPAVWIRVRQSRVAEHPPNQLSGNY